MSKQQEPLARKVLRDIFRYVILGACVLLGAIGIIWLLLSLHLVLLAKIFLVLCLIVAIIFGWPYILA